MTNHPWQEYSPIVADNSDGSSGKGNNSDSGNNGSSSSKYADSYPKPYQADLGRGVQLVPLAKGTLAISYFEPI